MKKAIIYFSCICLLAALFSIPVNGNDTLTVTDAEGFHSALTAVSDRGTINIKGTIALPADFVWTSQNKAITIAGGTLDFSKLTYVFLGNAVTFESITLKFAPGSSLFANGHQLTVSKSVTVTGEPTLYGGAKYEAVDSTNVTLMAGTYTDIFGGGYFGGVNGDVNLQVGGRVNEDLKTISHKHTYCVYGGGNNSKISGKVYLTVSGLARANYVFGGALGLGSRIDGGIEIRFLGGEATGICGGSRNVDQKCDVSLTMSGGTVEQIFGGCEHTSMTGDIELNILGGTITRRIYGGCYNEVSADGVWETGDYVTGDIYLTISSSARINFTTGGADRAIYAHSRQKTLSDKETTYIRFADEAAYKKYIGKLGAQDSIMRSIMTGVSAADVILNVEDEVVDVPETKPFPWLVLIVSIVIIAIPITIVIIKKVRKTAP